MFRPFAWISESRTFDKVNGEVDYKMASATRPVLEIIHESGAPKRKRDSEDTLDVKTEGAHEAKRMRTEAKLESRTSGSVEVEEKKSTLVGF